MASLRARLYALLVRRTVRPRLGTMEDIIQVRRVFDGVSFPDPRGVAYAPGALGGIPGEWVSAASARPDRAPARVLYLHGGGFVACSARTHRPVTGALARRGLTLFVPDYRLAPEHPFPAAIEDAVAAWRALSALGPAGVAGDSAGGNIALAAMLSARDGGLALPVAAALFSPATDLIGTGLSHRANAARDAMFDPESLLRLVPAYLGAADPADPLASPLLADLTGLPPLLLHVGEREVLRDDSVRLAEKARAAGVPVSLGVFPVVPHAWQFAGHRVPEARRSLDEAAVFLRAHLPDRGHA